MAYMAPVFISHGSPLLLLGPSSARSFLADWGKSAPRPKAIIAVSAHFETDRPVVVSDPNPGMIYDFYGFPRELYRMQYPAPGDPALAKRIAERLAEAGLAPAIAPERGYDHGTWVPLLIGYPEADIPVVQLSVQPEKGAAHHFRLGKALAPFADEGVLIYGSGSMTHNLYELERESLDAVGVRPIQPWAASFADWMGEKLAAGDTDALVDYRRQAPNAKRNHPSEEHILPLFVALGAAGKGARGQLMHASGQHGVLRMDAFSFDKMAA